ncbi:MAG TPA: DUF5691 domain-containing protein, partial [Albitalea sp.]|nr:DUF5691 domain-containing protein [Albitalea sp.]
MSSWAPLLPLAMVGTDRQATALPAWPGEVGQLLAQAASTGSDAAGSVLRAAAVLAACGLAGAQGAPWTQPMPEPAADDAWPALPDGPLLNGVVWALHDGPARLQHQVCLALASAQRRLPPSLLPPALELGRRSLALRALLPPVLGERGLWLAAQREDWRYAAGVSAAAPDDARWTEGSAEQRREFLRRERGRDPQAARERLAQSLAELSAKERADLVGVLAERLSSDDESFLDGLRADRSREVRQAALALLLQLPNAAHPQRAAARIEPLLKHERVLLRKRWLIDAPQAAADDWKADNVDAARPKSESLGERGWWLYQLVRQVPLAWWTQHTAMDAAELRDWASSTDWGEALLRGWRDVLLAAPDVAWCEAFLDKWPGATLRDDPATFLAMLPLARRERYWQQQLRGGSTALNALVPQMLAACPAGETLSRELSAALADSVRQRAEGRALIDDYSLRALLPELGCALHV